MLVSFLAHSILATNPPVADPTCHTGIGYYNYCCAKSCGLCGGWHCDQRDGGAKACCTTNIRTDSMQCSTQGPSTEFGGCMLASSSCADTLAQKNPSANCSYYVSHGKCAEPWIRDGCAFSCGNCPSTGGQGAWFVGISDIRVAGAKQPPYDQTNPTAAYATFNALSHTKQAMRGVSMYVDQPASKFGAMPSELYRLNGISTKAADWNRGFNNPQFLCFTIDQEAVVYILYDRKLVDTTHGYPKWLTDTFTDRHTQTVENVAGESYFEVFAKWFPRGKVCLGGNFQQRKATDVMAMYIPLVGPPLPQYVPTNDITGIISFYADSFPRWSGCTTESQDKTGRKTSGGCVTTGLAYEIAPMMRGSAYYLDRSYTFKDLPDWMSGLNGVVCAVELPPPPPPSLSHLHAFPFSFHRPPGSRSPQVSAHGMIITRKAGASQNGLRSNSRPPPPSLFSSTVARQHTQPGSHRNFSINTSKWSKQRTATRDILKSSTDSSTAHSRSADPPRRGRCPTTSCSSPMSRRTSARRR